MYAHLYGRNLRIGFPDQLPADLCGIGTGEDKFAACVFAVFLAEPISDIAAAMVTTSSFFTKIQSILENGGTENGDNGAI